MSFPRYPKYKDSGVEWLEELPEGWDVGPLKRFAKLQTGMTPPTDDFGNYTDEGFFQWIRPEDLDETGKPTKASKYLTTQGWRLARQIPAGATLICCIGTIGKSGITEDIVSTNQQITAAIPIANSRYLFYSITSARTELELASTGNVLRILNTERLGNICLPSPPRHEQQAIVAFLDRETAKIDALVAEQKNLIALLKEKRQAVISHAVTKGLDPTVPMRDSGIDWLGEVPAHWKVGKAKFYLSILPGYAFSSAGFSRDENDVKLLRGINVGVGELRWDEIVYWSRKEADGLDRFELMEGDIVVGMDRPLISSGMRVAEVRRHDLPCLLLQRVAKVLPNDAMNSRFILTLLSSRAFEAHFAPETTGVSVPLISGDQISSFVIPIPPLGEQEKICNFIRIEQTKFDDLTTEAQHTIDLLKERRSALISAAVTGKIDVRGYHVHSQPIT